MDFLSPLFITPVATGLVFAIAGLIQQKWPPKKINDFYGYRTKGSRANQARWDFAQQYGGKQMVTWGLVLAAFGVLGLFWDPGVMWSTILSIVFLLIVIAQLHQRTERALDEEFGSNVV